MSTMPLEETVYRCMKCKRELAPRDIVIDRITFDFNSGKPKRSLTFSSCCHAKITVASI